MTGIGAWIAHTTRPLVTTLAGALLLVSVPRAWLPLPPPLPQDPPKDEAAPVPDRDLTLPDSPARGHITFALRLYPMRDYGEGDGYVPGSAYQSPELRKPMQPPGFIVTVPLQ